MLGPLAPIAGARQCTAPLSTRCTRWYSVGWCLFFFSQRRRDPGWGKPTVTWSPEVDEVLDISTIGCTANHYGNTQVADDASKS